LTAAIKVPTIGNKLTQALTGKSSVAGGVGKGLLTNMPWRKANVKHMSNEVLFNIVEEVNVALDQKGKPSVTDVNGRIECTSHLSGIPDVTLDFRNSQALGDCSWHPSVRVRLWQRQRVASFVPPDGTFTLCNYRLRDVTPIQLPFYVTAELSYSQHSGSVNIRIGSRPGTNLCRTLGNIGDGGRGGGGGGGGRSSGGLGSGVKRGNGPPAVEKLAVIIQFPPFVRSFDPQENFGKARYDESTKVCRWDIGTLVPERSSTELHGRVAIHEVEGFGLTDGELLTSAAKDKFGTPGGSGDGGSESRKRGPSSSVGSARSRSGTPSTPSAAAASAAMTRHYKSIPIKLEFSIPRTNVSGLSIASMDIKNIKYKPNKVAKMETTAGIYEMRL
jgi:hypothetical protein